MATMMSTPAALACETASAVCGMMPSAALTTITAMSVTLAPRARILVNASWPGVSRKVVGLPSFSTRHARSTWVMPPVSVETTSEVWPYSWRILSSSDVLPWSTWPMMVTIGARRAVFSSCEASAASRILRSVSSSAVSCFLPTSSMLRAVAMSSATSNSTELLIE